ncbi:PglL family O-oligosaccharyltransferase [Hydrogenophaga sp.]|uniref:PglL family O-oligosaccharyltransferase n=1 Tax=Hydrogenophaga sp. TaxID=1904254 RepID=UPI0026322852|nr:O-antigen ligase family protein [Hydrogenophaga sp.]
MLLVFCWPWVLGPSLTVVPFAAGLLAAAIAGLVLRPVMPVAPLAWFVGVVGVAWLSGGSDRLSLVGLLAAAAACAVLLAIGRLASTRRAITQAFMAALVLAMVWHVAVAWLQFFDLERAFEPLANLNPTSRPYGNLRQSNHLASFALLGLLAAWWRHREGLDARSVTAVLAALAYSGVALSGSRTGLLCAVAVSAGMVLLLRRPSRLEWWVFVAGPLWVALIALVLPWLPVAGGMGSEASLTRGGASVSARIAYWAEAWELALRHPLRGVGWGELGRARFEQLAPQPGLQNTVNAHNLVLHLLAEVGFLGTTIILAPVAWLLWSRRPWHAAINPTATRGNTTPDPELADTAWAWLALAVVGLHSLTEYPLWYMPFLLPTAFAFGLIVGGGASRPVRNLPARALAVGVMALLACTVLALVDYAKVSTAFGPSGRSLEDPARALAVQRTVLFRHYADRALLERVPATPENTPQVLAATARLLGGGPSTLLLWVRLSVLCEVGRNAEAWILATRFKALFPEAYAKFHALKDPAALARCGLAQ